MTMTAPTQDLAGTAPETGEALEPERLSFLPDGGYDLSTPAFRFGACKAALRGIALVPNAYRDRGAEFCRDEMQRRACDLLHQLRLAQEGVPGIDFTSATRATPDGVYVLVQISHPKPSPRILRSEIERDTALDFEVQIDVGGASFEGSVTVYDPYGDGGAPSGRWAPCRSGSLGWIHGNLHAGIRRVRALAGARGGAAERELTRVLSGLDWPKYDPWSPTRDRQGHEPMLLGRHL